MMRRYGVLFLLVLASGCGLSGSMQARIARRVAGAITTAVVKHEVPQVCSTRLHREADRRRKCVKAHRAVMYCERSAGDKRSIA